MINLNVCLCCSSVNYQSPLIKEENGLQWGEWGQCTPPCARHDTYNPNPNSTRSRSCNIPTGVMGECIGEATESCVGTVPVVEVFDPNDPELNDPTKCKFLSKPN